MPKLDGKGSRGEGPKTGRGLGNCDTTKVVGRGQGQGLGNRQAGNRANGNRVAK